MRRGRRREGQLESSLPSPTSLAEEENFSLRSADIAPFSVEMATLYGTVVSMERGLLGGRDEGGSSNEKARRRAGVWRKKGSS